MSVMTDPSRNHIFDPEAPAAAIIAGLKPSDEKKRLLILGANWCPDAKAFTAMLETNPLAAFVESHFQPVLIDVGRYDHNMDIPTSFGLKNLDGLPSLIILGADDQFLNAQDYNIFRNARTRKPEEIIEYLLPFIVH